MVVETFLQDSNPNLPKILFIGIPYSSHNLSWIGMLSKMQFNIRFFGVTDGYPPDDWPYKTYLTTQHLPVGLDPKTRLTLYPKPEDWQAYNDKLVTLSSAEKSLLPIPGPQAENQVAWLAEVITSWEPMIIHTMGFDPASYLYLEARDKYNLAHIGTWIAQSRGVLDLLQHDLRPLHGPIIERILSECDQLVADNPMSYQLAERFGLHPEKASSLGMIPGSGGVEVNDIRKIWKGLPSERKRVILWPKAVDNIATRALPIFEALKECWDQIKPCEIWAFPGFGGDLEFWFNALPLEIRESFRLSNSVSRNRILELMAEARVMLAPSLTDGVPNVLYEAMAAGAMPIVSPLDTLLPVFKDEENVLYARNLFPSEMARAIVRAMNDHDLIDQVAIRNFELVSKLADRQRNTSRVNQYYQDLSMRQRNLTLAQQASEVQMLREEVGKLKLRVQCADEELRQKTLALEEEQKELAELVQRIIALEEEQKGMVKVPGFAFLKKLLRKN